MFNHRHDRPMKNRAGQPQPRYTNKNNGGIKRMKKTVICSILISSVLSGCAQRYCHSSKSSYDFERDKRRCMHQASAYAASWGSAGNPFMIVDDSRQCLEMEYGWYKCSDAAPSPPQTNFSDTPKYGPRVNPSQQK